MTRAIVCKLAARLTDVQERRLKIDDLLGADEMFITSSTIEIVPVLGVGRRRVAKARVGELTRELQMRYRRYVARRLGVGLEDLRD